MEAAHRFAGSQVHFVGIDVANTTGAGNATARAAALTYPQVADPSGLTAGAERITGLPFTVILNPQGDIVVRHPGVMTTEQLEYLLENYDSVLADGS